MNPNTTAPIAFAIIGALFLAFALIMTNTSNVTTRVPTPVIEHCIGLELESNKSYHRIPTEILTYCLEKKD